jgi:nucleoid-associated protein YgaU
MTIPTVPTMPSRPVRLLKGVLALLLLASIVGGIPLLLTALGTVPSRVPSIGAVSHALTTRDDGQLLGRVLAAGVWACWALFTASVLSEAAGALRRRPAWKIPKLGGFQRPASRLIAVIVLGFTLAPLAVTAAAGAVASPASTAPPLRPITVSTATVAPASPPHPAPARTTPHGTATPAAAPAAHEQHSPPKTYTVVRYDTLWSIAERHLGNGLRYTEIAELNRGTVRADNEIVAGDVLRMPQDAAGLQTAAPAGEHPAARVDTVVTVQPGDTLSSLEQAVNGAAGSWQQGWAANAGRTEPGGARYDNPDLIRPGWTLHIPGQAVTTPVVTPPAVVTPAPAPVARLVTPPLAVVAPVIIPPADSTAPPTSVAPVVGPPRVVAPPAVATSSPEVVPVSPPEVIVQPAPSRSNPAQSEGGFVAFAGGGVLLAGLALGALKGYRRRQFRLRRPGRVIGATSPSLLSTESTVVSAGKVGYADVTWLDHALRGLVQRLAEQADATLPDVVAVRLAGDVLELVLAVPATTAPAPWTASESGQRWSLRREHDVPYDGDRRGEFFAPYPTLVSVGYSTDGEHWLIDLERVGALSLQGDPGRCLDLARYLAAELAHNTWSEMLSATMVGFGEELAPMNPDRLSFSSDADRAVLTAQRRHHSVVSATSKIGVDVLTGRFRNVSADAWASHVLFVAPAAADPQGVERLLDSIRANGARAAVAVVLADATEHREARWQLTVDATGLLTIPALGVEITAQRLPVGEGRQLAQLLFDAANTEDRAAPPAPSGDSPCDAWYADACGALHAGLSTSAPPTLTVVPSHPTSARPAGPVGGSAVATAPDASRDGGQDRDQVAAAADTVEGVSAETASRGAALDAEPGAGTPAAALVAEAPGAQSAAGSARPRSDGSPQRVGLRVAADVRDAVLSNDPLLDADLAEWWDPASTRPKVTLLGPIRVRAQGTLPADRPREAFHAEVVAYLVTRPRGVRYQQVDHDLWPGRAPESDKSPVRVRNAMSKVRRWLGTDADGREYLPKAADEEGYRVDLLPGGGVLVDEQLFRRLRLRSQVEQGANRIGQLHKALDLVTGYPFDDQRDEGYRWLVDTPFDEFAKAMIDDVAHEIADYYLPEDPQQSADPHRATEAADVALRAGSTSDTPWLDKMRAAYQLGRIAEAETYVRRIVENNPSGDEEEDLPKSTYDVLLRYRALG